MPTQYHGFVHPDYDHSTKEDFDGLWMETPDGCRISGTIESINIDVNGFINAIRLRKSHKTVYHVPFSKGTRLTAFCTRNFADVRDVVRIILNNNIPDIIGSITIEDDLEVVGFGNDTAHAYAVKSRDVHDHIEGDRVVMAPVAFPFMEQTSR